MTGRAGATDQAEKVREARELVERKGRRALGNGDYSVDPGWHIAAELLPIIDAQAADLANLRRLVAMTISELDHECRGSCPDKDNTTIRDPDCLACAMVDFS